jgi:hypothetical protein
MKKMKSFALVCIVATLASSACRKDTAPPQSNISKEKLAGTYKVTAMKLKGTNGTEADLFTTLPDCQKAGRQTLSPNSSYLLEDACNPADNQTGSWAYVNNRQIVINGLAGGIVSFDGTNLVLSFENLLGMPGTLTETLTKQ